MHNTITLYFDYNTNISMALIGKLEEIASFVGTTTRAGNSPPVQFESQEGHAELPSDQFQRDLAAARAYFTNSTANQPPANLNMGHLPFPDKLKPLLPLLPKQMQDDLYYLKPAEDVASRLVLVGALDLQEWMAKAAPRRYRYPSQAVRDMFVQRPEVLSNFGAASPSLAPYPRIRAYRKLRLASRASRSFNETNGEGGLAICIRAEALAGRLCVQTPLGCNTRGVHTWIISGGDSISLNVTIRSGAAHLDCPPENPADVSAGDSKPFSVPHSETRLVITNIGASSCAYTLTNACTETGIVVAV